jgi:hypothetical protein
VNQKKKALLQSIIGLEAKIKLNQYQNELDKRYFAKFFNRNQYTVITALLPALIAGWKGGKKVQGTPALKKVAKFGYRTIFNFFRNYIKII